MTDKKPQNPSEAILASRRNFLAQVGPGCRGRGRGDAWPRPAVNAQTSPIKWRLQTYSGAPLGAHVIKPQIDAFNAAANGEMEIELYYADQLVPTADLFRALQNGTLDAVQSDEATMASPVDISVFGGYFPFATRYSLDVPALFQYYGLKEIWEEAYNGGRGRDLAVGRGLGPAAHLHRRQADPQPGRYARPARVRRADRRASFLSRYGLIPVTIPWDNVEVAMQTGELDGVAWCGFTEAYEVGWADVCKYALTNSVTGAWFGSYFRQHRKLAEGPAAPAGTFPHHHRPIALLPSGLVLGRRGQASRRRREDGADLAAGRAEWAQVIEPTPTASGMRSRPRRRVRPRSSRHSRSTPTRWKRPVIPIAEELRKAAGGPPLSNPEARPAPLEGGRPFLPVQDTASSPRCSSRSSIPTSASDSVIPSTSDRARAAKRRAEGSRAP
jgi:hypothetical protein